MILTKGTRLAAITIAAIVAPGIDVPIATATAPATSRSASSGPVTMTTEGPVMGVRHDGIEIYKGIPYAAPPVGPLRWRPPAPPRRHKLIEVSKFASSCSQITTLGTFADPSVTEDCLYLNIFTAGKSGGKSDTKKPVIFWIHGGGNYDGGADAYDGSRLATGGPLGTPVVVVTINYRLGLLGYLSENNINAEGHLSGNYGTLDQQAALRWVRSNIAAFGGDPDNITLAGESSGAENVLVNVLSPLAKGLFKRAIFQSYPPPTSYMGRSSEEALKSGNGFAAAAGCHDAACLRALPVARILQLQGTLREQGRYFGDVFVDGKIHPLPVGQAIAKGAYNHMPIMAGSTRDEGMFLLGVDQFFAAGQKPLSPDDYARRNDKAVLARYPLDKYENNPAMAQSAVNSDQLICSTISGLKMFARTNRGFPVYGYEFSYRKTPSYLPRMDNPFDRTGNFRPMAYHTADMMYIFPTFHGGQLGVNLDQETGRARGLEGAETRLSDEMIGQWTNFARTGNPNRAGDVDWPAVDPDRLVLFSQDIPSELMTEAQHSARHECDFWQHQDGNSPPG